MFRVPKMGHVRHHQVGDATQPHDDIACGVEPAQMAVTDGEELIRGRKSRIVLDREDQLRHRLVETPSKEMREADEVS